VTQERDMGESGSYCIIGITLAGDDLKCVIVSGDLTFCGIKFIPEQALN
jgi:hypothetical protein